MESFVHLHVHSHYSLLDGLSRVPQLVKRVKEMGMPAVALTDHGAMHGAVEFYQACLKESIQPIIGLEAYVAPGSRFDKNGERYHHLTLLAATTQGYKNLIQLATKAHLEGFYYKPRIDWELLGQLHEGIIALSGCLSGEIAKMIERGMSEQVIISRVKAYQQLFGADHYYFEVQRRPTLPVQERINDWFATHSTALGVPIVATNDSHYLDRDDADAQDVLLCLQTKSKKEETNRLSMVAEDVSLATADTMRSWFADHPEYCDTTLEIAQRCSIDIPLKKSILPHFALPPSYDSEYAYLAALCEEGLVHRYGKHLPQEVRDRLTYELSVIEKTGFVAYFLIVADFVGWAKQQGIVVGPGRGSAAGSLVSYLLNITNVDPIAYHLFFERFLNPERISMPDIDLDFADTRRNEVLGYVEQKYGKDHVAQIITFGTMAARAAVRDCGRVLGFSYTYGDRLAKLIPMFTSLEDAIATVPDLKSIYDEQPDAKLILDTAKRVEGVARHSSTHACAVVISDKPLTEYVPLQYASGSENDIVTQYEMHAIEDLGLLKMDFLGLKNLTIIERTLLLIRSTRAMTVDLDHIPLDDEKTFDLLRRGDTTGVFQLESSGMKRYLKELQPTSLEDIIAMVALYRPGPMELIPDFIAGKQGKKRITYLHSKLKPILEYTYGIAVYQEQVLQIARDIAGFSLGEADVLRKAIGKKIKSLLMEQREKFVNGAMNHGVTRDIAQKLFDFTEPFARYGFNRAHATCYGLIAYQTAYLKANFPEEYFAALLTSEEGDIERVAALVEECRLHNHIEVLPPDINQSEASFSVVTLSDASINKRGVLRFGLKAMKNVGEGIVETIIAERHRGGAYASLENVLERLPSGKLNRRGLESIMKCGALDCFYPRTTLIGNIDGMLEFGRVAHDEREHSQASLFGGNEVSRRLRLIPPVQPASQSELLQWEKEFLGLYLSGHPFQVYQESLAPFLRSIEAVKTANKKMVMVAGMITATRRVVTKKGELMLFVTIADCRDTIDVVVFPRCLQQYPTMWNADAIVLLVGKLETSQGMPKVICDQAQLLTAENLHDVLVFLEKRSKEISFED